VWEGSARVAPPLCAAYPSRMAVLDLQRLVRRRLFELGVTPEEASRRSRGDAPRETIRGLVRGELPAGISDRLARALARALEVPEVRIRRAAGLPVMDSPGEPTRPHLRLIRNPDS
jgi:hypothetical protein